VPLSIVSASLVSPVGIRLAEHAFFTRAGVLAPAPQAFETRVGERVDTLHCGFLGAALPIADRLARLAEIAVHQALAPWEQADPAARVGLILVVPERQASMRRSSTSSAAPSRSVAAPR
jgi:hypothetical protein